MSKTRPTWGFVLHEITYIKYFGPILKAIAERQENAILYVATAHPKITLPVLPQYSKYLRPYEHWTKREYENQKQLAEMVNNDRPTALITVEGAGCLPLKNIRLNFPLVVLPAMTDFCAIQAEYSDHADFFLAPGKFLKGFVKGIPLDRVHNIPLPKYDPVCKFDRKKILNKYNLPEGKYLLLMAPNKKDIPKCLWGMWKLRKYARERGMRILFKTRDKHQSPLLWPIGKTILDPSLDPATSLELLFISDLLVTYDSTAFKEAVILLRPMINFHVKAYRKDRPALDAFFRLPDLPKTILDVSGPVITRESFHSFVDKCPHGENELKLFRDRHFFTPGQGSNGLLDQLLNTKVVKADAREENPKGRQDSGGDGQQLV